MKNKAVRKYLSCILASAMAAGMMQPAAAQEPEAAVIVEAENTDNGNDDSDTQAGETMGQAVELEAAEILELPEEWQDTEPETTEQSEPDMLEENTADTEVSEDTALDTDEMEGENPQETESELLKDEAGIQMFAIDEITVLDETMPLFATEEESGTCGEHAVWTRKGSVLTISGSGAVRWSWNAWQKAESIFAPATVSGITEIIITEGITELISTDETHGTFTNFIDLEKVTLPDSLTQIGTSTFSGCTSLTSIKIPASVTDIGAWVFQDCTSLKEIELPVNLTSIGESAFFSCSSLSAIKIPAKISVLKNNTFTKCASLTTVELPDGLKTIESGAFSNCSSLKAIEIPTTVTTIDQWAFGYCSSLTEIEIPSGVTVIEWASFRFCTNLKEIRIPDSVTTIEAYAFGDCTRLRAVELPSQLSTLEESVFYNCTALTSIGIPAGITEIRKGTFENCTNLSTIAIPKSVTTIDPTAFIDAGLTTIYGYTGTVAQTLAENISGSEFVDISTVDLVTEKINAIPDRVTLADKPAVKTARTYYDELSDSAKAKISDNDVKKLTDAEAKIVELEVEMFLERLTAAEKRIAELEVEAAKTAIEKLPDLSEISLNDRAAIEAARAVYEGLTEEQKQTVPAELLTELTAAENRIMELEKAEQDKETEHVHAYSAWKTTSEATVFSTEMQTRTCSCGEVETRTTGEKLPAVLELPGKLTAISIKKGNTKSFQVIMANGDSVSSVKSSAAKTVKATLDKKTGEITLKALKTGTAKLTIKLASGESKKYSVNVVSGTVKTKALSVTSVKNKKLTLAKGKTHTLKAERKPFTSTQKLTYTSSNKKVATVSSAGKIKAVAPGKATITVKSGSKSVKITVTVPGIANVKTSVSVKKNKTLTLNPKIYGIAEKVTYTSSNKKVATVTAKGKIKGIKKGTAKITIQAGSYKTTVKVKVQ